MDYRSFAARTGSQIELINSDAIIVDCSLKLKPVSYKASGFLQTCIDTNRQSQFVPLISPLKPQLFRMNNFYMRQQFSFLKKINLQAKFQLVMSDSWGQGFPLPITTSERMGLWKAIIDTLYKNVAGLDSNAASEIEWDIWNEFDFAYEKEPGWPSLFYKLWDSTFIYLRKKGIQRNQIAGPSFGAWRNELLDFINHAKNAGTLPGILTWHELNDVSHTKEFSRHVKKTREKLFEAGSSETKIYINEYSIGDYGKSYPHQDICKLYLNAAYAMRMITNIENSEVDLAARACHGYEGGKIPNHCWKAVLNGLVTDDLQKRSVWWVYQFYGAMSGVTLQTTSPKVDVIASIGNGTIHVLLGKLNSVSKDEAVTIMNIPKEYVSNGTINTSVRQIINSDWQPSPGPIYLSNHVRFPVKNGAVTIPIPNFSENSVVEIKIQKP